MTRVAKTAKKKTTAPTGKSASRRGGPGGDQRAGHQIDRREPWPWTDDDAAKYGEFVKASTLKVQSAKEQLARRAVETDRLCRLLDSIANKTAEELRAHNSAIKIYRRCIADLDLLDTTNKDEPGKL